MLKTVIFRVFKNGWYATLFAVGVFLTISSILLLPNAPLIGKFVTSADISLWQKVFSVSTLYGSFVTNNTSMSAVTAVAISVLFPLNVTLFVYYLRRAQVGTTSNKRVHLTGVGGMISAVLGIGCAACGSVLLTAFSLTAGAGGLLLFLPFHGAEFSFLGILLLGISIFYLVKKINDPLVCRV